MTIRSRQDYDWDNAIHIPQEEADAFLAAWCRYRSELESDTLKSLEPELCTECNGKGFIDRDVSVETEGGSVDMAVECECIHCDGSGVETA